MIALRSGAELFGLASSLVATVLLTRALGPETFGFYAAAAVIAQLAAILTGLGLAQTGSVLVAKEKRDTRSAIGVVCVPRLTLGVGAMIVTLIASSSGALAPAFSEILAVAAISLPFSGLRLEWLYVAKGRVGFVSTLRALGAGTLVLAAIAAWVTHSPAVAGLAITAPIVVVAILGFGAIIREFGVEALLPDLSDVPGALGMGRHFLKGELANFVTMSSDRLFLLVFSTASVLGLYDAAYRIILPFYSVAAVVNDSSYKQLAEHPNRATLGRYSLQTLLLTLPAGFYFSVFAVPVIALLYGPGFASSAAYLPFLGWVITAGFASGVVVFPLTTWGRHRDYGNAVTAGSLLCVAANFVLIPPFAGVGAALATIAGKIGTAVVGFTAFRRASSYDVLLDCIRLGICATAAGAAGFGVASLAGLGWVVGTIVFGVVYVLGALVAYGPGTLLAAASISGGRANRSSIVG